MTTRTALRELRRLLDPLEQKTSAPPRDPAIPAPPDFNLPTAPTWTESDRAIVQGWKAYVKWEESNPLDLEDSGALHSRVAAAYRKACAAMRFYPEIWYALKLSKPLILPLTNQTRSARYMAYNWASVTGKPDEALAILKQGMEANKSRYGYGYAYFVRSFNVSKFPAAFCLQRDLRGTEEICRSAQHI